jgi:prepilin-type N-terminal cleavage/methylation domain-containing protein
MRRSDTTSAGRQGCGGPSRRAFTLIELLAAMAILVILMGMLFAIIGGAQKAYSLADSNAQIYEKAHVLFEQLSRDLRSAVASSIPGREVPIWIPPKASLAGYYNPDPAVTPLQPDALCLVVAGDPYNDVGLTRLNKVRYRFHIDPGQTNHHVITRSIDPDRTGASPGAANTRWDFPGITKANEVLSSGLPNWVTSSGNALALVGGVEEFTITPYPDDPDPSPVPPVRRGTRNALPQAFVITVTFVDERALTLPDPLKTQRLDQSRRTFRKIIFVGGEG